MRNILKSRQSNRGEALSQKEKEKEKVESRAESRAETRVETREDGKVLTSGASSGLSGSLSLSLSGRSDSDKENSRASKRRREPAGSEDKSDGEKRRSVVPATVTEGEGATCDWAYWYQPATGNIRPAKVTVTARPAPAPVEGGRARSQSRDEKPWRSGMKKAGTGGAVVSQEKIPERSEPVKPWRTNMRSEPRPVQPEEVKPRPEERAWRNNMKKVRPVERLSPRVPARQRHYDRREVRRFIREKKLREKGEHEEREKEENMQAEQVKRRLAELDKLQKEIVEADSRQFRRISRTERNLSEPAQEALREKLLELTEEMKSRWRDRERDRDRRPDLQPAALPAVLPQTFHFSESARCEENHSLQPLSSLHLQESPGVISVSEVSDATELKSLSENPRNLSSGPEESSKLWKARLLETGTGLEETVYRQLEKPPVTAPTPLTDEIPERDLSKSARSEKSEKLRQIVKEVLDRHKTDLDFIRTNMKERTVQPGPGEEFTPKYPTILTTPPSLPQLEVRPRPVPAPTNIQEVPSDSSRESERPPQWMDVTRDEVEPAHNLSATVYKRLAPDQDGPRDGNSFMATVVRKYSAPAPNNTSVPSDMALSEGVLSDMSISSPPPPPPPVVDSKTYSKDDPDILGKRDLVWNIFYF